MITIPLTSSSSSTGKHSPEASSSTGPHSSSNTTIEIDITVEGAAFARFGLVSVLLSAFAVVVAFVAAHY